MVVKIGIIIAIKHPRIAAKIYQDLYRMEAHWSEDQMSNRLQWSRKKDRSRG